jgi:hypothetical protein
MKANYSGGVYDRTIDAESSDSDKVSAAINECRMKIKVLP